jgi:hypothetical protein
MGTAPPAASEPVSPESTVVPVPDDAVPFSPAPAPQPAPPTHMVEEPDDVTAFAPTPERLANSGVARIDDDWPVRPTFASPRAQPTHRDGDRRSAVVACPAGDRCVRVSPRTPNWARARCPWHQPWHGARDKASMSAPAVAPAAPATTPIAADTGAAKRCRRSVPQQIRRRALPYLRLLPVPRLPRTPNPRSRIRRSQRSPKRQPRSRSRRFPQRLRRAWRSDLHRAPDEPTRGVRWAHAVLVVSLHANAVQPAPMGIACAMRTPACHR